MPCGSDRMNIPNMLEAKKRTNKKHEFVEYNKVQNNFGKDKKYFIRTYGCQMNEHDSENIKGMLESVGFTESNNSNDADVIIMNTCAIRENAHDKVFGFLGEMKHQKKLNLNKIICICGCMAQELNVVEEIKNKYRFVDLVFGTHNLPDMLSYLEKNINNQEKIIEVYSEEGNICENIPVKRDSNITAWVNIMLGCDKFCTYCIVPYTRGKQRSRKKEDIIKEVIDLKNKGYKEITLLGQNVNAYGKDLYDNYNLANLLEDVSNTNIDRIRFVTSHPWDFTDEMIEVISKYDNIMPYIHLPFQSGSNKILKLMGRRYTKEEYLTLYNKIRKTIKDVSITTDIIVGFPGETEEDFTETLDLVEKCKFDGAYTFIFSPRENTPAAKMIDDVDEKEKKERLYKLNKLVNSYSLMHNKDLVNKSVKCLVLSESEKDKNKLMGYTASNKLVNITGDKSLIGKIINVKIKEAKSFSLDGEVEEK